MQNKYDYLVACDWLSYSAYGCPTDATIFNHYKLVDLEKSTQVFKNLSAIIDVETNEQVATLQHKPRSKALKPNLCIIKISNRMLYESDFVTLIKEINNGLNLVFNSISRVDICADFYTFKSIHPHRLIELFLKHKIRRFGKSNYNLRGNQDKELWNEYEYLRFGASTSNIITYIYNKSEELRVTTGEKQMDYIKEKLKQENKTANADNIAVYLYNKSEELRAIKSKPYISRRWDNLKFDVPDLSIDKPDVWRLEFRITAKNVNALNTDTAELVGINFENLQNEQTLIQLFLALVSRHWRWAYNDPKVNKFCDLKEIILFDIDKGGTDLLRDKIERDPRQANNRATLTFIKHFMRLSSICNLPYEPYVDLKNRLAAHFPKQYKAAQEWAIKQDFRNETDDY